MKSGYGRCFNDAELAEIAKRYRDGQTTRAIATAFQVNQSSISRALHRAGEPTRPVGPAANVKKKAK